MTRESNKFSLFAVYFTFFIDNLSWGLVFPIFAPYFLDVNNVVFSADVSSGTRSMILGFFFMVYSLGQFIGAPLAGEYADRNGRKRALIVTVFFTLIGTALSALSVQYNLLLWLFVGRMITGIFSCCPSICLSSISDLSLDQNLKVKRFGYFATVGGLAFIIGAFFGGKLADHNISPFFSVSVPFWSAAFLILLNFLFALFGYRETSRPQPFAKYHFGESFKNIQLALRTKKIKGIYSVYFLFIFSWTILFLFFPVLAVEKFGFTSSSIGNLALFMGVCWAIGSSYLGKTLVRYFTSMKVLEVCLVLFTILSCLVIFPSHVYGALVIVGASAILGGLAWPLCAGIISDTAPSDMQGKILGISQSILALSMTLAPAIGGIAFKVSSSVPFLLAAGVSCIALIIAYRFILKPR